MSYICSDCGKLERSSRVLPRRLCQACYNYYRKGGTVNPLPAPGTIQKDERGYVICHIAYANGMPERLQRTGFDTRIKVGERNKRLGKKTRLQESIDKQMRKARSAQYGV